MTWDIKKNKNNMIYDKSHNGDVVNTYFVTTFNYTVCVLIPSQNRNVFNILVTTELATLVVRFVIWFKERASDTSSNCGLVH